MEFLEFFLDWFYMFNLYDLNFHILIGRTISVYFLWFDYYSQGMKNWKVQNHSVSTCYLHKWLVYLNVDMFTVAMFFFCKIPKYVQT